MMTSFNRRTFLQGIGVLGAAAALSGLLPRTVRAQSSPTVRAGRVLVLDRGAIKVHTYIAPDASVAVTSHLIETPNALVAIDAQFLQTFGREFRAYADSLGKPLERVILSHAHPDHYLAANLFEDVPFVATVATAEGVQAYIDGGNVANLVGMLGESEVPAVPRVPEGVLEPGDLVIDGVTFTLSLETNAEAPEHLVVRLPDAGVIVLQDLLYANMHFFPGQDRANWIAILETLRDSLSGYDTLLAGHGLPTTRGELDTAIEYLTFANATVATATSADDIIAALQERFPGFEGTGILPFWAQFFQPG